MNKSLKIKLANIGLFIVVINAIINLFSGEWLKCGFFIALYAAIVFLKGKIRETEEKRIKAEEEELELSKELEREKKQQRFSEEVKEYMAELQKKEDEKFLNLTSAAKRYMINKLADDINFISRENGSIKLLLLEKFHKRLGIPGKFSRDNPGSYSGNLRIFENFTQHSLKTVEHMVLEENKEEINKLVSSLKESEKIERERIAKLDLEINQVEANRLGLSLEAYTLKKEREETSQWLNRQRSKGVNEDV